MCCERTSVHTVSIYVHVQSAYNIYTRCFEIRINDDRVDGRTSSMHKSIFMVFVASRQHVPHGCIDKECCIAHSETCTVAGRQQVQTLIIARWCMPRSSPGGCLGTTMEGDMEYRRTTHAARALLGSTAPQHSTGDRATASDASYRRFASWQILCT